MPLKEYQLWTAESAWSWGEASVKDMGEVVPPSMEGGLVLVPCQAVKNVMPINSSKLDPYPEEVLLTYWWKKTVAYCLSHLHYSSASRSLRLALK